MLPDEFQNRDANLCERGLAVRFAVCVPGIDLSAGTSASGNDDILRRSNGPSKRATTGLPRF